MSVYVYGTPNFWICITIHCSRLLTYLMSPGKDETVYNTQLETGNVIHFYLLGLYVHEQLETGHMHSSIYTSYMDNTPEEPLLGMGKAFTEGLLYASYQVDA